MTLVTSGARDTPWRGLQFGYAAHARTAPLLARLPFCPGSVLDAALITSGVNVRYLTGLVSSNAALLMPAEGPALLATDSRYTGTAQRDCADLELLTMRLVEPELLRTAVAAGWLAIGFEDQEMTVQRHRDLAEAGATLTPLGSAIDELRYVKDETEIGLLARACAITGDAFCSVLDRLRPGTTERAYAIALERAMIDLGAEEIAFGTIVASGPNGAIPHHVPGDRPLADRRPSDRGLRRQVRRLSRRHDKDGSDRRAG